MHLVQVFMHEVYKLVLYALDLKMSSGKENLFEIAAHFLSSSSDSDFEDELGVLLNRRKIPKIENFIEDVVYKLTDKEFQQHFRLLRSTANGLIESFKDSKYLPTDTTHGGKTPISAEKHVLSFLWYAGNKCALRDVAQRFCLSISTLHCCLNRVMDYLIEISPTIISMPHTEEEKEYLALQFQKISGFPNVIGCIDGTSIHIRTPAKKIKNTYVNRHDIPAVTVQAICDFNRKFIDIFTGTPGKIHDARVFKMSDVSTKLPALCGNKFHILGDNAYPIRVYLLTPYKDYGNLTHLHQNYNKRLSACRVLIENSFGILKGRFRQLQHIDMHSVDRITKFIMACCVVHNLCIDKKDFIEESDTILNTSDESMESTSFDNETQLRQQGERKRDAIKMGLQYL